MFPKLISLVLLAVLNTAASAQESRFSGFEAPPTASGLPGGWSRGIGKGNAGIVQSAVLRRDSSVKHGGRYALMMELHDQASFASVAHCYTQPKQASKLRLKAWMKTEGLNGSGVIWIRADGEKRTVAFVNSQYEPVRGTTGWKEYVLDLPYDRNEALSFCYGAFISGSGRLWVDDITLEFDGKAPESVANYTPVRPPATTDTSFSRGSGIQTIAMTPARVEALANLGAVWGFIKYYHPAVKGGMFNMDAALFRVLPEVVAAPNTAAANAAIERWVDGFGKPAPCSECKPMPEKNIAQKPDYGRVFDRDKLPASLISKLEYIRDNRGTGESYYIRMADQVGNPEFRNERDYGSIEYLDAGLRLLSAYRYWNAIRYFFPYQHLIGEDWNAVLPGVIPEFAAANDTADYQRVCLKLIARINDTHAGLWGNNGALRRATGQLMTPFTARFIGEQLVVTGYYNEQPGIRSSLKPGDIIETVDSVPVKDLIKRYQPLTSASNYATQLRDMPSVNGLLLRGNTAFVTVGVRDGKGLRSVQIERMPVTTAMWAQDRALFRPESPYRKLEGNIGYIYPAMLSDQSLDSVKAMFKDTKGLVVDLRCYPTAFMPFTYGAWLKRHPSAFVKFTGGSAEWPGLFQPIATVSNGGGKGNDHYKGKLVIIVDATTQSQAEYTTMALQTVPGAVTIGSTTAGADGNVSEIVLPGGLRTMISGIDVLYPDGTETQRAGVKIDRVMQPTVEGIRAGRDELLEAAMQIAAGADFKR